MQKDVIYIDTEDDITSIIGKVRASEHKIVALVPPKRIGAIQSAVNLKLVHRAANQAGKNLVLISSNTALMALAGSTGIPVAKNLQSKPELAEVPALDIDGEDVIDGSEITVPKEENVEDAVAAVGGVETTRATAPKAALGTAAVAATRRTSGSKVKVPNFDSFRKRLFLIITAVVLLAGFFVWAIVFAPSARITVAANTSDSSLNTQAKFGDSLATSLRDGTVKSVTKTTKTEADVVMTATGTKNVGEKAIGSVNFSNSEFSAVTIAAGTKLTSASGNAYTLDSSVTVPAGSCTGVFNCHTGNASGSVTAINPGTASNGDSGSLSGTPSGVSASFSGSTSGGTDKKVDVVQQSDVDTAKENLFSSSDSDQAKSELSKMFGDDYAIISGSFNTDTSDVKSTPAVGEEAADGKGTLKGTATYSLMAVSKKELGKFLDGYFTQQIEGQDSQKVYDNGVNDVTFTNIDKVDDGFTANITTNGKIGPKIDEKSLKEYAKGKRIGEIQSYVKNINGVGDVSVKLSPFWVKTAPNNTDKIRIEFKVND